MLYNRASADPAGRPWSERKKYVWWDAAQRRWTGIDEPDFEPDKPPDYRPPPDSTGMASIAGDARPGAGLGIRAEAVRMTTRDDRWLPEPASGARAVRRAPAAARDERQIGYYGQPLVKRPLWRWHIALYFFLEGISGAAFILAAAARRDRRLQRAGRLLALATLAPCPVLLTADLGRRRASTTCSGSGSRARR